MQRVVSVVVALTMCHLVYAQNVTLLPNIYDLGTLTTGAKGEASFQFQNIGDLPVYIKKCLSDCNCIVSNCPKGRVASGATVSIRPNYDAEKTGLIDEKLTVYWSFYPKANYLNPETVRLSGIVMDNSIGGSSSNTQKASSFKCSSQEDLERNARAFVCSPDGTDCNNDSIPHETTEEIVTSYFAQDLRILERRNLDFILDEQKRGMQGIFDENTLIEAGKIAGARYIIVPRISCFLNELSFGLKIISCEDASILATATATGGDIDFHAFLKNVEHQLFP